MQDSYKKNQLNALISQIYFWNKTLYVLDIGSFFRCTHSNVICHTGLLTACEQDQDGTGRNWFRPDPARKLSVNLYDIYHCCVYSEKTPDDGQRNCPKHVEFYSKNKI